MSRYALLSVIQAAEQLGKSRYFVYDEIKLGKLAVHKIGGCLCVSQVDLDAYVARSRVAAMGERKIRKPKEVAQ